MRVPITETTETNVVKFPYNACRRVHSRRPRNSINGTPEERAAKTAAAAAESTAATVIEISSRSVDDERRVISSPTRRWCYSPEEFRDALDQLDETDRAALSELMSDLLARNQAK